MSVLFAAVVAVGAIAVRWVLRYGNEVCIGCDCYSLHVISIPYDGICVQCRPFIDGCKTPAWLVAVARTLERVFGHAPRTRRDV